MDPGHKDARELLAFYLDAGADALMGEEPVDRMADEIAPAAPAVPPPRQRAAPSPASPPAERTFFQTPLPASPECNARCIGCISRQDDSGLCATQDRIAFVPTPDEICGVAIPHLSTGVEKWWTFKKIPVS